MKYTFIGAGNMASAIIRGMIAGGVSPSAITAVSKNGQSSAALAQELGIIDEGSAEKAIEGCNMVILAVKPNSLPELLPRLASSISAASATVVSIAAGLPLSFYEEILGSSTPIVRVMPNINAMAMASTSGVCPNAAAEPVCAEVIKVFEAIGSAVRIQESLFSAFTAIAGSSPAFAYIYIDTLARAGVLNGMSKKDALAIAAQTVLGSAKMVLESQAHPYELADRVCSPAGTTIEGVAELMKKGFEGIIIDAVQAVVNKDKSMKG